MDVPVLFQLSARVVAVFVVCVVLALPAQAETLRAVVERAVRTNPSIDAAAANRRATEYELRQSEGRILPRVDLDADLGRERIDRPNGFAPLVNDQWRSRRQAGVTLNQVLFDGFERTSDIYRNAARVSAASFRVLARSEIVALDAIEAYIDVRRHQRVIRLAEESVKIHRRILARVRDQADAGRVAQSDVLQVQERVAAAEASVERIRQSLLEAEAKFTRVVGARPQGLQAAGYPPGVPASRSAAVEAGLAKSPLVAAANADAKVARLTFEQSRSAHFPTVGLEVNGIRGSDLAGTPGPDNEVRARLVLRWTLFDGMINRHKQLEFAERMAQANAERDERARLVQEEIERATAAYYSGGQRLAPLRRQVKLSGQVVKNYETEYGLSKRSLLELLNAENARLNVTIDLVTTESLHVFSAYRILGAMGGILDVFGIVAPAAPDVGRLFAR